MGMDIGVPDAVQARAYVGIGRSVAVWVAVGIGIPIPVRPGISITVRRIAIIGICPRIIGIAPAIKAIAAIIAAVMASVPTAVAAMITTMTTVIAAAVVAAATVTAAMPSAAAVATTMASATAAMVLGERIHWKECDYRRKREGNSSLRPSKHDAPSFRRRGLCHRSAVPVTSGHIICRTR